MTRSLAEDLRTLAHTGRGADDDVLRGAVGDVAGQMVRQIRRRRAARQTGMGAVGVSAAAAIAVGATQGPGWLGDGFGTADGPGVTTPTSTPTEEPTAEPTEAPTEAPTVEPTPDPTPDLAAEPSPALPAGLALISKMYDLDLSCGAALAHETFAAAGGLGADHLTPELTTVPTRADQPVTVVNWFEDGALADGATELTPAVVVTRDGVVVGYGGGDVLAAEQTVQTSYEVTLDRLHQCAEPPMAADGLGTYTIWVVSAEAGFGGPAGTNLSFAAGMVIDLATGSRLADVGGGELIEWW